jgi:hypothetical protein
MKILKRGGGGLEQEQEIKERFMPALSSTPIWLMVSER